MDLKSYLKNALEDKIKVYEKELQLVKKSFSKLEKFDSENANYVVHLKSYWEDEGEKSITTEYEGSIRYAIEQAKIDFQTINKRRDIQGKFTIYIKLDGLKYLVPEDYWKNLVK